MLKTPIGLQDAYRIINGNKIEFTWNKRGNEEIKARLDHILIDREMAKRLTTCKIKPIDSIETDHSMITASFNMGNKIWTPEIEHTLDWNLTDKKRSREFNEQLDKHLNTIKPQELSQWIMETQKVMKLFLKTPAKYKDKFNCNPKYRKLKTKQQAIIAAIRELERNTEGTSKLTAITKRACRSTNKKYPISQKEKITLTIAWKIRAKEIRATLQEN